MTKIQNIKQNDLGDLDLTLGIYLEFEIWNLGFDGINPTLKEATLKYKGGL